MSLLINRGHFVVVEGPDLSGKSTFSKGIAAALEAFGMKVLWTTEPTADTPTGKCIREYLNPEEDTSSIDPLDFQDIFRIDRKNHLAQVINPALAEGVTVVCDRYIPSSIVYGKANGAEEAALWEFNFSFPRPDLTFVLQVGEEEARRRAAERGQTARLSKWDADPRFQERVRLNYWHLWRHDAYKICRDPANVVMLNGEETKEEIKRKAAEHLLGLTAAR